MADPAPFTGGFFAPDEPGGAYAVNGQARLLEINPKGKRKPREVEVLMIKAPVVSAGYGGWSRVALPRKMALTEWVGRDALSVTIEFIIDGFASGLGYPIETKCQLLDELAGVEEGDPEPPLLELHSTPAPLMPHGYYRAKQNKWFVESLSWEADEIRYNAEGNRLRAVGTLVMTVFNSDKKLEPAAAKRGSAERGGKKKTYTIKSNDRRFSQIAARKSIYGDGTKWKKIAKANGRRDVVIPASWRNGHKKIKIP